MYTLVVEDARYALKQLLGIVVFWAVPALSPPALVMGTSTTLLNHLAVGLLQLIEIALASPATLALSPVEIETAFPPFCTVSEKVNTTVKSFTGVIEFEESVLKGNLPLSDNWP
jgi:hypothetical protein